MLGGIASFSSPLKNLGRGSSFEVIQAAVRPANRIDEDITKNVDDAEGYNLVHLDTIYDLLRHVYVDASVRSQKSQNEHEALVSMIDLICLEMLSSWLTEAMPRFIWVSNNTR